MKQLHRILFCLGLCLAGHSQAALVYNSWTSQSGPAQGNYIFIVNHVGSQFSYDLTINPWNAEALGLFIDLGNVTMPANIGLVSTDPVSLFAQDTASADCGNGCNLNGLSLPALSGGDWELVFRLGEQGYDGLQSFSWMTSDFGLLESNFGLIAVRSQQLCSANAVNTAQAACEGSEKAYARANLTPTPFNEVPEPSSLMLMALALGLCGLRLRHR